MVLGLLLLTLALTYRGADFYLKDLQARVDHPDFRALSPAGPIGQLYGIVGTVLILTNLLYMVRRRYARVHLGSMRTWLDIHVVTGLFGTLLVMFHSAFQLRSGIATLTAASLAVVVVTGIIGRYFYAISPRKDDRRMQAALQEVQDLWPGLAEALRELESRQQPPARPHSPGLLATLMTLPAWFRQARSRRSEIRILGQHAIASVPLVADDAARWSAKLEHIARLKAAEVKAAAGTHLLKTWRGLHRLTALLMVVAVILHVAIALYFGFGWSPSG
ncbi:MAG: hypothetical protein OXR73_15105 [Myxococcales bacterium]|nr:hypothetical protein [Myxococcales bacterium]